MDHAPLLSDENRRLGEAPVTKPGKDSDANEERPEKPGGDAGRLAGVEWVPLDRKRVLGHDGVDRSAQAGPDLLRLGFQRRIVDGRHGGDRIDGSDLTPRARG